MKIGDHRPGAAAQTIDVPHLGQGHQNRGVALKRGGSEVVVHLRGARQQLFEHIPAEGDGAGQAHWRPQGKPAADPVLERHDLAAREPSGAILGSGHRDDVAGRLALRQAVAQPALNPDQVVGGLHRAEALGRDHHQRRLRIEAVDRGIELRVIQAGQEPEADRRIEGLERLPQKPGPQVRSADADMDDSGEGPPARTRPPACADVFDQRPHLRAGRFHPG